MNPKYEGSCRGKAFFSMDGLQEVAGDTCH